MLSSPTMGEAQVRHRGKQRHGGVQQQVDPLAPLQPPDEQHLQRAVLAGNGPRRRDRRAEAVRHDAKLGAVEPDAVAAFDLLDHRVGVGPDEVAPLQADGLQGQERADVPLVKLGVGLPLWAEFECRGQRRVQAHHRGHRAVEDRGDALGIPQRQLDQIERAVAVDTQQLLGEGRGIVPDRARDGRLAREGMVFGHDAMDPDAILEIHRVMVRALREHVDLVAKLGEADGELAAEPPDPADGARRVFLAEEAQMQLLGGREACREAQEGKLVPGEPVRGPGSVPTLADPRQRGIERAMHVGLEPREIRLGEMAIRHAGAHSARCSSTKRRTSWITS